MRRAGSLRLASAADSPDGAVGRLQQQLHRELVPAAAPQQRTAHRLRLREPHLAQRLHARAEGEERLRVDAPARRAQLAEEVGLVEELQQLRAAVLLRDVQ